MFVVSGELTPLALGLIGAVIFFAIQLAFCLLAKKKAIKCIPLYLILVCALFCVVIGAGLLGSYSAGSISGNGLVAIILGVITDIAAVGVLLAWLVYWAIQKMRK